MIEPNDESEDIRGKQRRDANAEVTVVEPPVKWSPGRYRATRGYLTWAQNVERFQDHWRYGMEYLRADPKPPTGLTPKYSVWRYRNSRVYRYQHDQEPRFKTPVVLIYALINKPYILDMIPGFSMVEYLVQQGFDVYLLDWGDFGPEEANLTIDHLIFDRMRPAIRKVVQESGGDSVSLIGISMGGTLAALYASLFEEPKVLNLVNIGGQIDFSDGGIAGRLMNPERFDPGKVVEAFPLVPPNLVTMLATLLNPVKNLLGGYTRFWRLFGTGMPVLGYNALNKWGADGVNYPGSAYVQWITAFTQKNRIVRGEVCLRGEPVRLERIQSSILALSGARDHTVPGHQVRALIDHTSGQDKTYKEYPIDHDGLLFGRLARQDIYPHLADWLAERSEVYEGKRGSTESESAIWFG
ncbi:MAG: alpha/beta fold hydrolase [Solirubrobacterales bacterium]